MSDSAVLAAIAALDGRLATLDGKLDALASEATTLRVDVLDRFERVESRPTKIREDMTVTMGRADRAHEAADNTRKELRLLSEEVRVLTRKQRRMDTTREDLAKRA